MSKATHDSVTGDKDFSGWVNFNQDGTTTAVRTTQVPSHNNDITPKWYVDGKSTHYFDKFVTGSKLDEQMEIGQVAYCDQGSIVVSGGDTPSTVIIKFTQAAKRAIYLKSIYIRYFDADSVEQTYEYTFTAKTFTEVGQTINLNGID